MKLRDRPLAVLDTETTGLDPIVNEIIEIAIYIPSRNIRWVQKCKPERLETASARALEVNGYTEEAWKHAKPRSDVIAMAQELLRGCVLLGQNISFDIGFYKAACKELGLKPSFDRRYVELYTLSYMHLAKLGLNSISLHNVCNFLGISNEDEHTAMADVERTWAAWNKLKSPTPLDKLRWRLKASRLKQKKPH